MSRRADELEKAIKLEIKANKLLSRQIKMLKRLVNMKDRATELLLQRLLTPGVN